MSKKGVERVGYWLIDIQILLYRRTRILKDSMLKIGLVRPEKKRPL